MGPFVPESDPTLYSHTIPHNTPKPIKPPGWLAARILSSGGELTYTGLHNDLAALLKDRQTQYGWVMVFDFTLGHREFFLNVSAWLLGLCFCVQ